MVPPAMGFVIINQDYPPQTFPQVNLIQVISHGHLLLGMTRSRTPLKALTGVDPRYAFSSKQGFTGRLSVSAMAMQHKKVVKVIPLPGLRPQMTELHLKRSIGQSNGKSTLREEEFS